MGKTHIIELNGKRYDALTGRLVSEITKPLRKKAQDVKAAAIKSIDGFARTTRNQPPHVVTAHQAQKSQTLMRHTVKRPAAAEPVPSKHPISQHHEAASKTLIEKTPTVRLDHAKATPKSSLIQRFGSAVRDASPLAASSANTNGNASTKSSSAQKATTKSTDLVNKALRSATSHEQPKLPKRTLRHRAAHHLHVSPRLISLTSLVIAVVIIGGFFAYKDIPNLTMRVASARSGVKGEMPGYQPAGFDRSGAISYKTGQIVVSYKANSDSRNYKLIQTSSSWDSTSLLDNFVTQNNQQDYQTIEDNGKTIYLYNNSDATWVDGGVWYRIEGRSALNSEQLQSIAASL